MVWVIFIVLSVATGFLLFGTGIVSEFVSDGVNALLVTLYVAIIAIVVTILSWPRFQNKASPSSESKPLTPIKELESNYHQALDAECNQLDLSVFDARKTQSGLNLVLADVYNDQQALYSDKIIETSSERGMHLEGKSQPQPLFELVGREGLNRLAVLGIVGSGKSSFVDYLAHCILQSYNNAVNEALPNTFIKRPLARLILRRVGQTLDPQKDHCGVLWVELKAHVFEQITQQRKSNGESEPSRIDLDAFWAYYQPKLKEQGLILLDGLDEVSSDGERRNTLYRAIDDFSGALGDNARLILTSRPHAWNALQIKNNPFQHCEILPMKSPQISAFILNWYQKARQPKGWSETYATQRAQRLFSVIKDRTQLRDLCERPMLLTLVISLDYSDSRLPESRAELYEQAFQLLLERWHKCLHEFKETLDLAEQEGLNILDVNPGGLEKALGEIALKSYERLGKSNGLDSETSSQQLDITMDEIRLALLNAFDRSCDEDNVLYFLQFRSGLLVASGDSQFQFAHKSLHEYLVARALLNVGGWKARMRTFLDENLDWWQEVFLLLVKRFSDTVPSDAMEYLFTAFVSDVPGEGEISPLQANKVVLCARAALEMELIDKAKPELSLPTEKQTEFGKLYFRLQLWLLFLMQAEEVDAIIRAEAGDLLAQLGDPRFDPEQFYLPTQYQGQPEPHLGFIKIKGGSFMMGSNKDDSGEPYSDEMVNGKAHKVTAIKDDYWMARHPTTVAQYGIFIDAGGYSTEEFWGEDGQKWLTGVWDSQLSLDDFGGDEKRLKRYKNWLAERPPELRQQPNNWSDQQRFTNRPIHGVSWFEVRAYCYWLNQRLQNQNLPWWPQNSIVRLPTEAEWEKAARADERRIYPWGNEWDESKLNVNQKIGRASSVGMYPTGDNPYGLHDLAGNVWEWTHSLWRDYPYQPSKADWQTRQGDRLVLRGGSWVDVLRLTRCAVRDRSDPGNYHDDVGFRVVISLASDL